MKRRYTVGVLGSTTQTTSWTAQRSRGPGRDTTAGYLPPYISSSQHQRRIVLRRRARHRWDFIAELDKRCWMLDAKCFDTKSTVITTTTWVRLSLYIASDLLLSSYGSGRFSILYLLGLHVQASSRPASLRTVNDVGLCSSNSERCWSMYHDLRLTYLLIYLCLSV
jgi:hypothetical protein